MRLAIFPLAMLLVLDLTCSSSALSKAPMHVMKYQPPPLPVPKDARAVSEKWITQKLDHFDTSNRKSFQMRYLANDEFYQPGGPIFIFVGGEWRIEESFIQAGHTYDMAREMNAYLFYTEHRYYGKTHPTENLELENLKYLDIDQALEDLAHFIRYQKTVIPGAANSGVILVGMSYAAIMVAWFMQRHPTLANGAWSSSAPLEAKVDFPEYREVVGLAIRTIAGQPCYDRIQGAFTQIRNAMETSQLAMLDTEFKTCTTLVGSSEFDRYLFLDSISHFLSGYVQDNIGTEILDVCAEIMNSTITDDLSAYAAFARRELGGSCLAYNYEGFVDFVASTSWDSYGAVISWRQWIYQTCNELGFFTTLNSTNQPFGQYDYVHLFTQHCADAYPGLFPMPQSVHDNVARTNDYNFGLSPVFKNVLSTHGSLDPWSAMGLTTDTVTGAPVTIIPLASHCNDLRSESPNDSVEMKAVKEQIRRLIIEWLAR